MSDIILSPKLRAAGNPFMPGTVSMDSPRDTNGHSDGPQEPSRKKLRSHHSCLGLEAATSLEMLLAAALPDKAAFHREWIRSLAAPEVCITSLEDLQRLDAEDITDLPVPPLVKGVLREVLSRVAQRAQLQEVVLENTAARKEAFMAPLRDRNMQPTMANSKYFQDCKDYSLILAREEIQAGVRILAHRIETWAKGERVVLVGILKGAFMLMSDLCRTLVRPYSVYFVEASSYKDSRKQSSTCDISSEISETKFFDATTKAPHKIVLIDELLDNGKTMQDMKQYFMDRLTKTHTENDIVTVCLFEKKRERSWPSADITGIPNIPDLWLVGYGLDDRGTKRGWTELFAMPKVKLVGTFEKAEVDRLLASLDEDGRLTKPHVFSHVELTFNHKQKYRVIGLDANGAARKPCLKKTATLVKSKGDIEKTLATLTTVKGKYEQELSFSFIQDGMELVPEDQIFSGNNKIYAEMRCRLRKQIDESAQRFGLAGPADLI